MTEATPQTERDGATSRRRALAALAGTVGLVGLTACDSTAAPAPGPTGGSGAQGGRVSVADVRQYGAVGDGATDDSAAIAAAIAAASEGDEDLDGGVVYFPWGQYAVASALEVPAHVYLRGDTPYGCRIVCTSDDVLDAFVVMGRPEEISTYTGIENLTVDSNRRAKVGIYLYGPQEGSGLNRVSAVNSTVTGVHVDTENVVGASNMLEIARSWIWVDGDEGLHGLYLTGGTCTVRGTTFVSTNRSGAAPAGSAGIVAVGAQFVADNVNCEQWDAGFDLTRCAAELRSVSTFFCGTGVRVSEDSTDHRLHVVNASFDDTSVADVDDRGNGLSVRRANNYEAFGAIGNDRAFQYGQRALGAQQIYQSDSARAAIGFTSPASGDTTTVKTSVLTGGQWRVASVVDVDGTNGPASSAWNGAHLRLGAYHLWVDGQDRLRVKEGAPASDADGVVVGTQG